MGSTKEGHIRSENIQLDIPFHCRENNIIQRRVLARIEKKKSLKQVLSKNSKERFWTEAITGY
jgi:hypothetical protein